MTEASSHQGQGISPHAQEWINALRSEKYSQAHHTMRATDQYCCLGVACDISGKDFWEPIVYEEDSLDPGEKGPATHRYKGSTEALPVVVAEWLELRNIRPFGESRSTNRTGLFYATPSFIAALPDELGKKLDSFMLDELGIPPPYDDQSDYVTSLARLNDAGFTFQDIANLIEANPPGMFSAFLETP